MNDTQMKYIASCSGGKDSIATIILAHENKEPLDLIIFSEVMFDKNISGELPEHIDFIKNKAFPLFEKWGYETKILHSDRTYMDCFFHKVQKSKYEKRIGKYKGFVMTGKCDVQRDCKLRSIKRFFKEYPHEFTQYIGIAVDETKRLERVVQSKNQISLLKKYGYTEKMAYDLCEKYDLLSPIYQFTRRGGCWFCPNAREGELRHLRTNHRELWDRLLSLENQENLIGNMWNILTKTRLHDWEEKFYWEERQMDIFDFIKNEEIG